MYKRIKIILPVICFIVFGLSQFFQWLTPVDYLVRDTLMSSRREAMSNIVIVGIDERSINEVGTWPWPRYFVAETITQLTEMGAAAIGVNVLYTTTGAVPEYDEMLIEAARAANNLVLAGEGIISSFQEDPHLIEIDDFHTPFGVLEHVTDVGFVNVAMEDGVMRRAILGFRFGDVVVHSFPYQVYSAYRRAMGQEPTPFWDIPLDDYGQFPIRFVGGPNSFRTVSLWGVINGHYPPEIFRDAIVLVGPFAQGMELTFTTPMERSIPTHGVEMQANVIQNLLEGIFLVEAPWLLNLGLLIMAAGVLIVLFQKLKPVSALVLTLGVMVAIVLTALVAYRQFHVIIRTGDIIVFAAICYLIYLTLSIIAAQNDKQEIKNLFARFVAPEVVNEIILGGVDIQLGGSVKEITALFVDIRGFTAFSEANPPEKVVDMVNRYLGLTSNSIQKNNGTIDKYIGDATMALFNAPNNVEDHPLCAVKAAWAMKEGAAVLQADILKEFGVDLQFGIGINTGTAVVGNMGSDFRMDYTAIGDAINTAARLESNASKGQIVISGATYEHVKDHVEVEDLGEMHFKNKSIGVQVYSVIGLRDGGK